MLHLNCCALRLSTRALCVQMPHYHAQEATEALKPVLGDYYKFDSREVYSAMWHDWRACRFVSPAEQGSGVLWYRK